MTIKLNINLIFSIASSNMTVNRLLYLFKLLQYSTILPITYDSESSAFKRSQFLQFYSIILLSIVFIFATFFTFMKIFNLPYDNNYFNQVDLFCVQISLGNCFLAILLIIKDKIFYLNELITIINYVLSIEKCEKVFTTNNKFIKQLILLTTLEIILFPCFSALINGVFSQSNTTDISLIPLSLFLTLTSSVCQFTVFPIRILFEYFDLILSNFVLLLINYKNINPSSKDLIEKIDYISNVYHKITEIVKFVSQFYGLVIILSHLDIYLVVVWQIYKTSVLVFVATKNLNISILLPLLYFLQSLILNMKTIILLHRSFINLLKQDQYIRVVLNDLRVASFHYEVRRRVRLVYLQKKNQNQIKVTLFLYKFFED